MYTYIYLPGQDGNAVNVRSARIYIFDTLEKAILSLSEPNRGRFLSGP